MSDFICGYPLFILLVGGGLFFLIYSGFVPLRYYSRGIRALRCKGDDCEGQLTSFEALASAISATVGMGNIAGVAIALSIGGPGAIFWMWISAVVGMATKFFEGTLSVMFKGKDRDGEVQGGPMYMMVTGLGASWRPLAVFFSISALIGTLTIMQSNQLTEAVTAVFFVDRRQDFLLRLLIGAAICLLVSIVILGGIRRISKVATRLAPVMVAMYFLLVFYIIITHFHRVDDVFASIFTEAFTLRAGIGGGIGGWISIALTGIRRAALVNEAGIGTASMMHGASRTKEPVREGLVAMIEPSIDSGLVCTLTAVAILIQQDVVPMGAGMNSVEGLTVALNAFDASIPGVGKYLLLLMVLIFAFSTMFSYSYYGQKCTAFLFGPRYAACYNYFFLFMLIVAAVIPLKAAVGIIDLANALMAFPTMFTLLKLSPCVKKEMKRYFAENK